MLFFGPRSARIFSTKLGGPLTRLMTACSKLEDLEKKRILRLRVASAARAKRRLGRERASAAAPVRRSIWRRFISGPPRWRVAWRPVWPDASPDARAADRATAARAGRPR